MMRDQAATSFADVLEDADPSGSTQESRKMAMQFCIVVSWRYMIPLMVGANSGLAP